MKSQQAFECYEDLDEGAGAADATACLSFGNGRGKELIACSFPVLWTMSNLHGGCGKNDSPPLEVADIVRTRESLYPHQLLLDSLEPSQSAPSHHIYLPVSDLKSP